MRLQRRHHPRAHLDAHLRRERHESWEGGGDARADAERACEPNIHHVLDHYRHLGVADTERARVGASGLIRVHLHRR